MQLEQKKIERFKDLILGEIEQQAQNIIEEQVKINEDMINEIDKKQKQYFEEYVEIKKEQIDSEFKKELSQLKFDAKKLLIKKNTELGEEVYAETKIRLKDFGHTPDYNRYVLEAVEQIEHKNQFEDGKLFIKPSDQKLAKEMVKILGIDCEIVVDESIELGGFKLMNNKGTVLIDHTLEEKLSEKHNYFIQNCNLLV
jgi:vacuolar-type H+-ATPase subunit E/Vma4